MKNNKLDINDEILSTKALNTIGKGVIDAWKKGRGNWLDFANSETENQSYLLEFRDIKNGEIILDNAFKKITDKTASKEDYITAVILLDSIYSTRLWNPIRVGEKIYDLQIDIDRVRDIDDVSMDDYGIKCVRNISEIDKKNSTFTYSFATKFCNRINNNFPIIDSYVAGLIYKKANDGTLTLASLGDYHIYAMYYKKILDKCNVFQSFKEIDIYFWTFAKIHRLAWSDDLRINVSYKII